MPSKAKRSWAFDTTTQIYRNPSGRAVSYKRVRAAMSARQAESAARMRGFAETMTSGESTLAEFQAAMHGEMRLAHIEARMLAVGGRAQMTPSDWGKVGANLKAELKYLRAFSGDIASGQLTEAGIHSRAEKYAGSSLNRTFVEGRFRSHKAAGFTHKQRVGPDDEHTCGTCRDEIAKGKVPIDEEGFEIGHTDCMSNDRCDVVFFREDTND